MVKGNTEESRQAKGVCHVGAQPEAMPKSWIGAVVRLLTRHGINGGSANKAPHNKNLVKSHSSHSGDFLGHRHHKMASVLCI